jgi:thioredoxin-like negative regulator of GroEL
VDRVRAKDLKGRISGAQRPLVACFTRAGSAPSDTLATALEAIRPDLAERVDRVRVDMDEDKALMDELRIFKVPELFVYAEGQIVERTEGEMSTEQVEELLDYVLEQL